MDTLDEKDSHPLPLPPRARPRRGLWLGLGLAILGVASVGAASAPFAEAHGFGAGGGPRGGMFGGHGAARIERMLDKVGATDGQKAQVKAIWAGLRPELKAAHQQHAQLHKQLGEAMAAPTIDTALIEKLRQQAVQSMDKTSALMTRGLVATAQVLTPEQRKQALAEMQKHGDRHGRPGPDAE